MIVADIPRVSWQQTRDESPLRLASRRLTEKTVPLGERILDLVAPTTRTIPEAITRALPLTSEAWSVDDIKNALKEGNVGQAALIGGLSMLPLGGYLTAAAKRGAASVPSRFGQSGALTGGGPRYVDAYHGSKTPEAIVQEDKILPGGGSRGIQSGNAYGNGVYSTSTPSTASNRAYVGDEGAVFPLKIDVSNHLDLGNLSKSDYDKLNKLAEQLLLPSDKSMLQPRNANITITDKDTAHDFFVNQLKNWKQFGDGIERAKPKATQVEGGFKIEYTDYDAPVSMIDSSDRAEALLKTLGWDNVGSMGYSGHILPRSEGEVWHITNDPGKIRSRFANFDPDKVDKVGLGLKQGGLVSLCK